MSRPMPWRYWNKGSGTIEALTTLLTFYHGHGFNPSWVMLPDNPIVSKRVAANNVKTLLVAVLAQGLWESDTTGNRRSADRIKEWVAARKNPGQAAGVFCRENSQDGCSG